MKAKNKRNNVLKWIYFSLAVFFNAFIIVYSCLSEDATQTMNRPITNFFTNLVNTFTRKDVKQVPLVDIEAHLSDEKTYVYNYIPGYQVDEIPLGSAKQIECSFSPADATNKAVTYSASPSDSVKLNQNGSTVSVVGMKAGKVIISAKSAENQLISTVTVSVVETVAPSNFKATLRSKTIPIDTTQTIQFDIDGGPLRHDELINFRYYDIRKLNYSSSNEYVATVDKDGVIHPLKTGNATINVTNGTVSESFDIKVTSGSKPTPYSNLSISGSDVCYGNDMIFSQNSDNHKYQLTPMAGEVELNPSDFVWSTSNELLVRVDKYGVMRGFRKTTFDNETATIYAKSKLTGQAISFEVTVKNQLPTQMILQMSYNWEIIVDKKEYTITTADEFYIRVRYDVSVQEMNVIAKSSNENVISLTNEGDRVIVHPVNEGDTTITIESVVNPSLKIEAYYKVVKAGAIGVDDFRNVELSLRKSIGHAALFMVAQIFTYLTLYMFFYDKKWWFYSSISLGEGLFLAGLSELIQFFVPTRSGSFIDVLIDFAGVAVGAALTFLGIFIVKKIKEKRKAKKALEKNND